MANILGQITISDLQILEVDSDPSTSTGLAAPLSSIAMLSGTTTGSAWVKTGTSNTGWTSITLSSSGITNQQSIINAIIFG